jgi:hypothetical protein
VSYHSDAYRACAALVLKHAPLMIAVGGGSLPQENRASCRPTSAAERALVLDLAVSKPKQRLSEVAAEVGISCTMVWKILKRAGLPTRRCRRSNRGAKSRPQNFGPKVSAA